MEAVAYGTVLSSEIKFRQYERFKNSLEVFEGKDVEIIVRNKKKYRSNPQNRFYHGCVVPCIKYAMESKGFFINNTEQVHELLKYKFLKGEMLNVSTGELIETIGSTTRLSTIDFEDYLTKIRKWASEYLDCIVPMPNEQTSF